MDISEQFKGQPGGDPSRMPPMVEVKYSCQNCGKQGTKTTRSPKKFTPPAFCGTACKVAGEFTPFAREAVRKRLGKELPPFHLVGTGMFRSICKYENLIRLAEKDPQNVQRYSTKCIQCGKHTNHYRDSVHVGSKKSTACTAACGNSNKAGLPFGVSCENPTKLRFNTEAEAIEGVNAANAALVNAGEEQMVEYHCKCGAWHFGHMSKAVAGQEILAARSELVKILQHLIG